MTVHIKKVLKGYLSSLLQYGKIIAAVIVQQLNNSSMG